MASTYTQLQPGEKPYYGSSGQQVSELQTQLNEKNAGKAGWKPLKVDGLYGPLTQAGESFMPQSQVSVSSTPSRTQFTKNSMALDNALVSFNLGGPNASANTKQQMPGQGEINAETYSDPYTEQLDKISSNSDMATKNLIATIQAQRANERNQLNDKYDRYKQGLQLLGVQTGAVNYTPDIVMGNVMQAENARASKLQEIDRAEATALLEAKNARDEKDFKVLKEKMDYVKQLKKDRINTIKENYDSLKSEKGIADIQASQIYDELQKLTGEDKQVFLQAAADRFGIPVGSLVASVSDVARKRNKTTGSGGTSTGKFSLPKQISEFNTKMDQVKGEDGFIDPYAWVKARNTWQSRGGSLSTFNSNFKRYLNPASYSIAGFKTENSGL